MVQPQNSFVIAFFFLALFFSVAFTSKNHYPGLKSLHFSLYEQNTFNKTTYLIVKGVDTGAAMSQVSLPFGSLVAFHDPLTVKRSNSSKVVGVLEGMSVSSSLDGLQTINVIKITLSLKNHKGSISIVGAAPTAVPGDLTVVGGTGDFMFVQGYITSTPIVLSAPASILRNDFHLYWPPYATK